MSNLSGVASRRARAGRLVRVTTIRTGPARCGLDALARAASGVTGQRPIVPASRRSRLADEQCRKVRADGLHPLLRKLVYQLWPYELSAHFLSEVMWTGFV